MREIRKLKDVAFSIEILQDKLACLDQALELMTANTIPQTTIKIVAPDRGTYYIGTTDLFKVQGLLSSERERLLDEILKKRNEGFALLNAVAIEREDEIPF